MSKNLNKKHDINCRCFPDHRWRDPDLPIARVGRTPVHPGNVNIKVDPPPPALGGLRLQTMREKRRNNWLESERNVKKGRKSRKGEDGGCNIKIEAQQTHPQQLCNIDQKAANRQIENFRLKQKQSASKVQKSLLSMESLKLTLTIINCHILILNIIFCVLFVSGQ